MATSRAPCSTAMATNDTPTVMVVGKSGMGKSTLCNSLLYGRSKPDGGFRVESGAEPGTTLCASKYVPSTPAPRNMQPPEPGGPLAMVDTPGIPDPSGRTLRFYDDIVRAARGSDGLNALIVAVVYGVDRQQIQNDFETYRILLKQFAKLPCFTILLCRARIQPDLDEAQYQAEKRLVKDWVDTVRANGGMSEAMTFVIYDNDSQATQLFELRRMVCEFPKVSISDRSLRTYEELTETAKALSDDETRDEALSEKVASIRQTLARVKRVKTGIEDTSERTRRIWSLALTCSGAHGSVGLRDKVQAMDRGSMRATIAAHSLGMLEKAITFNPIALQVEELASWNDSGFAVVMAVTKWKISKLLEKVSAIQNELENGRDRAAQERDMQTLEELKQLADTDTVLSGGCPADQRAPETVL